MPGITESESPTQESCMLSCFDEEILALPFYEPRHTAYARQLARWCDAQTDLWEPARTEQPEDAGRRILHRLGESGWLAFLDTETTTRADATSDASFNLTGGDLRSLCLAREGLAYADDLGDYAFSIQALAATPILRHGSQRQRQRYLPAMARGTLAGSFALSEESVGSDVAALGMVAERSGAGYLLNGHKAWVANGSIADVHCVIARTGEGPGVLGLTAFLVPATTPGVLVRERIPLLAPRAFAHLAFEDCEVDGDAVLGQPGGGFVIAMEVLERFRMTVGAAALGFARRAADAALTRARSRPMYGGYLSDLQLVKAALADMEVRLNASALLVARAAWEADQSHRRYARHSSIAKLYATEAAQSVVDNAVQLFGAAGLVTGGVTERLYRQIRLLRIYEGASEVQQMIIADTLDARRSARQEEEC